MADTKRDSSSANKIHFVLDDEVITVEDIDPTRTILQYLREDLRYTGTKEGCAEGDCGACTVVLGELTADDSLTLRAVNSCIQFLPTLDGKQLYTVESLSGLDDPLHPVQKAMVDCHGSQCGFCTPGFVMSLFALYKSKQNPARKDIDDALAGNLCRCTGYRPIVDAAKKMYTYQVASARWIDLPFEHDAKRSSEKQTIVNRLKSLRRSSNLEITYNGVRFFAPNSMQALTQLAGTYPEAHFLAGGTDVGLWVTKQLRELDSIIYVGNVDELKKIAVTKDRIEIGAAVTLTDAMPVLMEHYPDLEELFIRFASPPIRNAGTLGGNIANGSPIGDSMPALMTLGTTIVLRDAHSSREVDLNQFYIDYQKNDRRPGEVLERIHVPLPKPNAHIRSYKISKRFDQDISAVCGAYCMQLDEGRVASIKISYGGVAAIPKRAAICEQVLLKKPWNETSVQTAMASLDQDFQPISDMRASSEYRRIIARNLLYKFYLETSGFDQQQIRVYNYGR